MAFVGAVPVTIIRRAIGARGLDGRYVAGAETVIPDILMNVDPIPGEQTRVDSTGEVLVAGKYVITETELQVTDDYTGELGDLLVYGGKTYQVYDRLDYPTVITHYEYRAYQVRPRQAAP
jgi:hypothetical protein